MQKLTSQFRTEPLFMQVAESLAARIAAGEWSPGRHLPSELDLAASLGVSNGTMRKAIEVLRANGLVVRRQGKGTVVVDKEKATEARKADCFAKAHQIVQDAMDQEQDPKQLKILLIEKIAAELEKAQ